MAPVGDPPGPAHMRSRTPGVALAATIALVVVINVLGLPLRTDAAPLGIVSLQLATSVEVADRVLASWSGVTTARLLVVHGLDVLLPVAYAVAIRSSAARLGAGRAGALAVTAAIADQVENALMAVTILGAPTPFLVRSTLVAAFIKWGALAAALALLVRAAVAPRRREVEA